MDALTLLIDQQSIAIRVQEVAAQISGDYLEKDLVIVGVLKGALCLMADLMRALSIPFCVETVQCASYGTRGAERGELEVIGLERLNIHHRDVLVVDDIFDSGHTMTTLVDLLQGKHPSSLKTCVLLNKQDVAKVKTLRPDYVLFDIENRFVVGYGLDFKEQYRGLSGIYAKALS